ncbi:hypothetical protein, partial [Arthrobacter sp. RIT-PI-e]|uniref:hypothetical protein n=1 Tax=Arthrobacter sp. RIT-PI-e TaxID=1681197 RepID=UPI0013649D7B
MRRHLLAVAVELTDGAGAPGTGPDGGGQPTTPTVLTEEAVVGLASWHRPRLHRRFTRLVPGMLEEA